MIQCYIVDDEIESVETLKNFINQTSYLSLAGTDINPLVAQNKIESGEVCCDVTFLGSSMDALSGLKLALLIQHKTLVVFTAKNERDAVSAFETGALDYMVKPLNYDRFLISAQKILTQIQQQRAVNVQTEKFFFVNDVIKKKLIRLRFDDIDYIESSHNYIKLYTGTKEHLAYSSLKELESFLPSGVFMRVHKSYIINRDKIESIDGNMIRMDNGAAILIGESFRKDFFNKLCSKLLKKKQSPS